MLSRMMIWPSIQYCAINLQSLNLYISFSEDQIPRGFPTIDMGPQLKVVERTRTATMLCAASGNPDPEITWFKDFLPVDTSNNNGRIKQLRSGRVLLLFPPTPRVVLSHFFFLFFLFLFKKILFIGNNFSFPSPFLCYWVCCPCLWCCHSFL